MRQMLISSLYTLLSVCLFRLSKFTFNSYLERTIKHLSSDSFLCSAASSLALASNKSERSAQLSWGYTLTAHNAEFIISV